MPTDITGWPARRPSASSAVRCGPSPWRLPSPVPRSSLPLSTLRRVARRPRSPCLRRSTKRPPSVTTTPERRGDSYARRFAAERANSRIKDPATVDVARGWCRLMGRTPMRLWLACAIVVRNFAVADACELRLEDSRRRIAAGRPPRTPRRRRTTIAQLAGTSANTAP